MRLEFEVNASYRVQSSSSPHFTVQETKEMGFKIIIYPAIALLPYFKSVSESMRILKETGDAPKSNDVAPKDLFNACGLKELFQFDAAVGSSTK